MLKNNHSYLLFYLLMLSAWVVHWANASRVSPGGATLLTLKGNADNYMAIPYPADSLHTCKIKTFGSNFLLLETGYDLSSIDFGQDKLYYAEFVTGQLAGVLYDVVSYDSGVLFLDTQGDDLTSHPTGTIAFEEQIRIAPHWTLNSVFGDSAENLAITPTLFPLAIQDIVFIPNNLLVGTDKTPQAYYYWLGQGWRKLDDPGTDYSDTRLLPGAGIIVRRRSAGDIELLSTGNNRFFPLSIYLQGGNGSSGNDILFGLQYPEPLTLNELNLNAVQSGGVASFVESPSPLFIRDRLLIPDILSGNFRVFYYLTGTGWIENGQGPSPVGDSIVIEPGSSFFIRKASTSVSTDWSFYIE